MNETSFDGQTILVTGATSGVGRAMVLDFAAHGAHVALVARRESQLKRLAEEIRTTGGSAEFYPTDLTEDHAIERLAMQVMNDGDGLDVLVHSAGIFSMGETERTPVRDLDDQFRVNVRGPFLLTQKLLPALRQKQGQIVFVNSTSGLSARAGIGPYAASKHALKAVADALREEVNGEGIRVLSIFLGRTDTPMQEAVHRAENRSYNPDVLIRPAHLALLTRDLLLLPRSAEVTEITLRPMSKPQ